MAIPLPSQFRSATEFSFRDDQAEAIIRTVSYPRDDLCRTVIWFPPENHNGIRPSIARHLPRATSYLGLGGGLLDRLPLELCSLGVTLWHDILLRIDIHSLFKFRQANPRSRELVDSLHEYQSVVSHGLNLYCALLRTQVAKRFSLFYVYDALCTKTCTICGEFAGFISLLTWKRCCFICLRTAPKTRVHTRANIRMQMRLNRSQTERLVSFKTLPGAYGYDGRHFDEDTFVVGGVRRPLTLHPRNKILRYMGMCALPYYDRQTRKVDHGVSCSGCRLAVAKGLVRNHDRSRNLSGEVQDRLFTPDGLLEHFRWCEQAQLLWRSSDEGKTQPSELSTGDVQYFGESA
ncbi:hypothetical protein B0T17DRAFT_484496 [Bombardia bombarda]|uniref:F-box domain-containing protein n=1 Tax=Bombardia bombarda TaxID=252184 RepID=A0AA39XQI4_9PEZI|nr:hypothetical protein B0T17DRAFT_484496 [Bombardia bombarda]